MVWDFPISYRQFDGEPPRAYRIPQSIVLGDRTDRGEQINFRPDRNEEDPRVEKSPTGFNTKLELPVLAANCGQGLVSQLCPAVRFG